MLALSIFSMSNAIPLCVDDVIMPMECIVPISSEETSIEFHVVLIAADIRHEAISIAPDVRTHVNDIRRRDRSLSSRVVHSESLRRGLFRGPRLRNV